MQSEHKFFSFSSGFDFAPVGAYNGFGDGQTNAMTADFTAAGGVRPIKAAAVFGKITGGQGIQFWSNRSI